MTPTQDVLLACLVADHGQFVTHADLIAATGREMSRNQLRVQLSLLRRKLPPGRSIECRWKRGYRLTMEDSNV